MFEKVQMSMAPSDMNAELDEFALKIIIDKETLFVNGYEINVKLKSTEYDDYLFETNYVMTFDSFNEYESIEVPDEVIDNAVEFVEEEEEDLEMEKEEDN